MSFTTVIGKLATTHFVTIVTGVVFAVKRINDTQGHAAGDRALTAIGRCLNGVNNRNTTAYRIGGGAFVILFFKRGEGDVSKAVL